MSPLKGAAAGEDFNNVGSLVERMERFCKSWNSQIWNSQSWFGDLVVLAFLVVQFLDGALHVSSA